jgi:hypothetical protein
MAYYQNEPVRVTTQQISSGKGPGYSYEEVYTNRQTIGYNNRSGSSRPGWRQIISARGDASTGLLFEKWDVQKSGGSIQDGWSRIDLGPPHPSYSWSLTGDLVTPVIPSWNVDSIVAKCSNIAETQFLQKLAQKQTSFHGGVFLGEIRQAVRAIRSPLTALRVSFDRYLHKVSLYKRRRGRNTVREINRAIAGTYLEAVFGWEPLVSDIDDAMRASARRLTYLPPVDHVQAKASDSGAREDTPSEFYIGAGSGYISFKVMTEYEVSVSFKGGFFESSSFGGISTDFGVGVRNFVPTVWELIPWSFVADYFINVGDCLEALSASTSALFYVTKGTKRTVRAYYVPTDTHFNQQGVYPYVIGNRSASLGTCSVSHVIVQRNAVIPSQLAPSLAFSCPGLFSKQSLNLAALAAQAQRVSNLLR